MSHLSPSTSESPENNPVFVNYAKGIRGNKNMNAIFSTSGTLNQTSTKGNSQ